MMTWRTLDVRENVVCDTTARLYPLSFKVVNHQAHGPACHHQPRKRSSMPCRGSSGGDGATAA